MNDARPLTASSARDRATDEELAACAQEPACQEILLRRYEQKIRACARRMSLDRVDAEDLAQETFMRVLQALPRFEGRSSFNTWLTRIARNTCIDHFRRDKRHEARRFEPEDADRFWEAQPSTGNGPLGQLIDKSRACHLDEALAELPAEQRRIAKLALVEGMPQAEIARELGLSLEAVKGRLKRARARMRGRLSDPEPCPLCAWLGGFRIGADGTLE